MTAPTQDKELLARQLREEFTRTHRLAREAIDGLDLGLAIAHCRALRSLLWRAKGLKIEVTAFTALDDQVQEDSGIPGTASRRDARVVLPKVW